MLYYKVLDINGGEQGFITLSDFRFYHPGRKRMFMTMDLTQAQYIIFNGEYYHVPWLADEYSALKGAYPIVNLILSSKDEYEKAFSDEK